jgi:shikimate dehydrogenase
MADRVMRAAVLGQPIAHSLSPILHNAAYEALGLADWEYGRFEVGEDDLAGFLNGLGDEWAGLSLTMPLKQVVLGLLDHVEPLAGVTGSVNTVVFTGKGPARMAVGTNTDVYGIVTALREATPGANELVSGETDRLADVKTSAIAEVSSGAGATGSSAMTRLTGVKTSAVIGAGATGSSAMAALAELGCPTPVVFVRSLGRTATLRQAAQRMGVNPTFELITKAIQQLPHFDAVVSTLPPHAADGLAQGLRDQGVRPRGVLLDVAYDPTPTALISAWRDLSGRNEQAATGERMLLHQAAEQVRLMTGRPGPVEAMSAALDTALGL